MAATAREELFHGVRYAGQRFDCGNPIGSLQATIVCALERPALRQDLLSFLRGGGAALLGVAVVDERHRLRGARPCALR